MFSKIKEFFSNSKELYGLVKRFFSGAIKSTKKILFFPVKIVVSVLSAITFVFIMTGLVLFIVFGLDQQEGVVQCSINS